MTEEFKREERYIVIKHSDIAGFWREDVREQFFAALERLNEHHARIPQRRFLVIESDWPEFEPAWQMIEDRVAGRPSTASALRSLLAERNSLAFLLKRFVDGEHDQDENQSERHMYHDEAEALLAYLGGEVQGHTLVPNDALRTQREQIQKLTADEQEAADLCDRLSDLLRNTAIEVRGPEDPFKRHGFHDLPSRVKTVVQERAVLAIENERLRNGLTDVFNHVECNTECEAIKAIASASLNADVATQNTDNENVSRHGGGQT